MTGTEFENKLRTIWGEVGSGFTDPTRLNNMIQTASFNMIDKKIEEFQSTGKVTRELRGLINITSPITPTNGTIDVSATSSVVNQYYSLAAILVTSPYRSTTLSRYAQERKYNQLISDYTEGDASDPRYLFSGDILTIEPSNATSAVLTYFKVPFPIDVLNNTTPIPYNGKLIELLIEETINVISQPNRDQWMNQISLQSEVKNP